MRKLSKIFALILGIMMLLCGAAAAESALPEIPVFSGVLEQRLISTEEEAIAYAQEFWALDYMGMDMTDATYEICDWGDTLWHVLASVGNRNVDLAFDENGNVVYVENILSGWSDICHVFDEDAEEDISPDDDSDEAAEWRDALNHRLEYPFLKEVNPALYEEYAALYPPEEGDNDILGSFFGTWTEGESVFDLYYSECYSEGQFRIKIGVQTKPVIRIVFFDIFCNGMEGGNG